jgi:hypothetical protein
MTDLAGSDDIQPITEKAMRLHALTLEMRAFPA